MTIKGEKNIKMFFVSVARQAHNRRGRAALPAHRLHPRGGGSEAGARTCGCSKNGLLSVSLRPRLSYISSSVCIAADWLSAFFAFLALAAARVLSTVR